MFFVISAPRARSFRLGPRRRVHGGAAVDAVVAVVAEEPPHIQ